MAGNNFGKVVNLTDFKKRVFRNNMYNHNIVYTCDISNYQNY